MELAELLVELFVELAAELVVELEARVEIRQLKELKVFDSLRLSIVVAMEILVVVLAVVFAMDADCKNLYVIGAQSLVVVGGYL